MQEGILSTAEAVANLEDALAGRPISHPPLKKRSRGGQPGNQNARKTGLYTDYYEQIELRALSRQSPLMDLPKKSSPLKVFIRRVIMEHPATPTWTNRPPCAPSVSPPTPLPVSPVSSRPSPTTAASMSTAS